MKNLYIILLFIFTLSNLFGQVTLTYTNNGLLPGDTSQTLDIAYIDPGNPGENQIWDFSGIQYKGKSTVCAIAENGLLKVTGANERNLVLSEDGYDYTCISGENGCTETGYVNAGKKMILNYTDPVVRMKYPFSYEQHFSIPFTGVAWYNQTSRIDLSGESIVTADAFGTLILPDRILKNVLRVKLVKQSLQIGVCGSTQANLVKYFWYAPGYRYPVLMVATTESKYAGEDQPVVKNGWVNLNQRTSGILAAGSGDKGQVEAGDNSVIVYPNPFSERATYNYFLRKQLPATVELYDMSGKLNLTVEPRQLQTEGLHTGTIDAALQGMLPGVYYLRFTLDKQVIVSKIVKI